MRYLPTTARIYHKIYRIFEMDQRGNRDGLTGSIFYNDHIIFAKMDDRPLCDQLETFWHEAAHEFRNLRQLKLDDDQQEILAEGLPELVIQILRDNPVILELHKKLAEETVDV